MPRVASLYLPDLPIDRLRRIEAKRDGRLNSSPPGRGGGPRAARWRGFGDLHSAPSTALQAVPLPASGEDLAPIASGWRPGARWAREERTPSRQNPATSPQSTPLVTVHRSGQRMTIAAACPAARALGLQPGMAVTQARALVPGLEIRDAEPEADAAFLNGLALFAVRRWTPRAAVVGEDGLWLDLSGVAHLFGGEERMCRHILRFCARLGLAARIAVADTFGAAHALARHGGADLILCPQGGQADAIAPLPIAALRLELAAVTVRRLGIEHIGELIAMPRAPLGRRFGHALLTRLDQALGRVAEAIEPIVPEELPSAEVRFMEPVATPEAIAEALRHVMTLLVGGLEVKGLAGRRFVLRCTRVDGEDQHISIGTARATRDSAHLMSLLATRIERIEPGFGIEAMRLTAMRCEPLAPVAIGSVLTSDDGPPDLAPLIDRLANRLGPRRIFRMTAVESDVPERSLHRIPPLEKPEAWPDWPRPVRLLARPEAVEQVVALLPDGPPRRFTWRGETHVVCRADGPERIYGEWWKRPGEAEAVRDYFQVEDEAGARFWLFRRGDGVDGRTGDLSWYVHGVFG